MMKKTKARAPRLFAALLAVVTIAVLVGLQRHGFDPAMMASRLETSIALRLATFAK